MGFWIFASVALFSLVFLYTKTKGQWNWKMIINKTWKIGLVLVLLPIALITLIQGYEGVSSYFANKPKVVNSYGAIKLGDKYSDVSFNTPLKKIDLLSDREETVYNYDKRANVTFSNATNLLTEINQRCTVETVGFVPDFLPVNGIDCNARADDILKKYGKDNVRISCENEEKIKADKGIVLNMRIYDVPELGIRHTLMTNQLLNIELMDPKVLKASAPNWTKPCD